MRRYLYSFALFALLSIFFLFSSVSPVKSADRECYFTISTPTIVVGGDFSVTLYNESDQASEFNIRFSVPKTQDSGAKQQDQPTGNINAGGNKSLEFSLDNINIIEDRSSFNVSAKQISGGNCSYTKGGDSLTAKIEISSSDEDGDGGSQSKVCELSVVPRKAAPGDEVIARIKNSIVNNEYKIVVKALNDKGDNYEEVAKRTETAIADPHESPFSFTKTKTYTFFAYNETEDYKCEIGGWISVKISGDAKPLDWNPITSFSDIVDILKGEKFDSVGALISALVPSIFSIAAMLAFLFLIWGGIRYMTSRGDPKAMEPARHTITSAVVGLLIVLLAGVIYTFIALVFKIEIFNALAPPAYASNGVDIGCALKLGNQCIFEVFPSFGALFTRIIEFALAAAALVFFAMLLWGGFRYLNAGGSPDNAEAARGTLTNAGIGLLIVVVSFVIIEVATNLAGIESIFNP
jgi:TRAP-type C4-dicarboxylate transport system permease small subunit